TVVAAATTVERRTVLLVVMLMHVPPLVLAMPGVLDIRDYRPFEPPCRGIPLKGLRDLYRCSRQVPGIQTVEEVGCLCLLQRATFRDIAQAGMRAPMISRLSIDSALWSASIQRIIFSR
ncbi:hypothetical protein, partial [Mesorhizobium sp. M1E.F.Ca.ET.063.01.1.1]|uniref:hypothetical protein n=1 Tax=Mesorhizobium sp. M1E.F.Ca.ET.063.01.1.1 TaxID=2496750 RepID=UPI001AECE9E1